MVRGLQPMTVELLVVSDPTRRGEVLRVLRKKFLKSWMALPKNTFVNHAQDGSVAPQLCGRKIEIQKGTLL